MKIENLIKKRKIYIKKEEFENLKNKKNIKILSYTERLPSPFDKKNEEKLVVVCNIYNPIAYEDLVVKLIEEKYSINSQIAIIRQKNTKMDEYNDFYNYCEQCKSQAKNFINERNNINNNE